ncbi:hypothetical protein HMI54_008030 [Coelomomyces lativittatus]|nr:hypothetical protein HMI54_008030 [Coelomomyces lativittatus]
MFHAGTICIVPVGLPARGKTYMSTKLARYLKWLGVKTQVFNTGEFRRKLYGPNTIHHLFNPDDTVAMFQRNAVAEAAFQNMMDFFGSGGQVAIYDSTLTIMQSNRKNLLDRLSDHHIQVIFIETICNLPHVVEATVREVKLNRPEYDGWSTEQALQNFLQRIESHVPYYESIVDSNLAYIKVKNMGIDSNIGEHIVANNLKGYLQTRLVFFLLNLHITPRTIYLLPNAPCKESASFKEDPKPCSKRGTLYAKTLTDVLTKLRQSKDQPPWFKIWTSTRKASYLTAQFFPQEMVSQKNSLVQLNPGAVDGLTDKEIQQRFSEDHEFHRKYPFTHRYPRAESYKDLVIRMEPLILELEGEKDDVLIIAHPSVLKCLHAYLMDQEELEIPNIEILPETLIELHPHVYGSKKEILRSLNLVESTNEIP